MSKRTTQDYRQVFSLLKNLISSYRVKKIVLDFERALWRSLEDEFPNVSLVGCGFHWPQALFGNFKAIGLTAFPYSEDPELQSLFRQLLSLNLLPPHEIPIQFNRLRARCHGLMASFCDYINTTWITSSIWPPYRWSVYMVPIRTNNEAEGYHSGMQVALGHKDHVNLYILIDVFREDALDIPCSVELMSQQKLTARHRAENESFQSTLFCLWDDYQTRKIDGKLLLEQCVEANLTAKCFKFNEALLGKILV